MNQIRDWDGHCQRCEEKSEIHTMSIFDVSLICMKCHNGEKKMPGYKDTCDNKKHREIANDPVEW